MAVKQTYKALMQWAMEDTLQGWLRVNGLSEDDARYVLRLQKLLTEFLTEEKTYVDKHGCDRDGSPPQGRAGDD